MKKQFKIIALLTGKGGSGLKDKNIIKNGINDIKQLSNPGKIAYLFMQSLLPTIPASFLAFGTEPLYSAYLEVDNIFDVSVINDQTMAGLVLKLGGGLILWIFILITWMKWYKTEKTFDDVVRTSTND